MRRNLLSISAGLALAALALTGCTSSEADTSKPTPTPASSESASATDFPKPTGECIDGVATFVDNDTEFALPDGCETVDIIGSGNTITLGDVTHLILESNDNTIDVDSVESVTNLSFGNTVRHGGDAPDVPTGADDVDVSAR
ncbi:DUF3060 domain-containing protein [Frigoribacterium faeni]|uniref:DUF3060 domain-containing protein n=1 Tax=Frigoribacterium faeni TaxID=145483 RepID=A0A7W3JFM6_9MICO|nr:DUF3060 domain-containing protein [Frigoribacterium faeni]MBA8811936.1 hypothetical protein [Frigoribacterium faeni]BFF12927.1 hypothetical protein GCM10025699_42300 [Microbacterium flavescens]GEK83786.1 hypothetical protein FFA01_20950 [Frigoribacterium faeni]